MGNFLRKNGMLTLFIAIGIYAIFVLRGPAGVPALLEKQDQIRALQMENAKLDAANQRRRHRIERLKHSQNEQELEIRERLKKLKPNETQLILPESSAGE
jgi:cell division protein FtsB